ncbi:ATP-binding cassette domain-containing protein [Acidilobus saccharovorans]|uniref:ATP-binding cassette domain-containing protein n=1 Tax=Acidilobus saccharovorans TaxID=242703 RepID=UPI0013050D31
MGESGSGKSTLANIMVGLVKLPLVVESGSVMIEGKVDVLRASQEELNRVRGTVIYQLRAPGRPELPEPGEEGQGHHKGHTGLPRH